MFALSEVVWLKKLSTIPILFLHTIKSIFFFLKRKMLISLCFQGNVILGTKIWKTAMW